MPTPISPEQELYFRRNNQKPANIASWLTFTMAHPDFSENVNLVAILDFQAIEFDDNFYTFEGVTYRPVSMKVQLPNESKDDNGRMTITFPRAGSQVKRQMKRITPVNSRVPISFSFKQYQEGVALPVRAFNGNVSLNYPKISGEDVSVQADIYNPSLLLSNNIITISRYQELRNS